MEDPQLYLNFGKDLYRLTTEKIEFPSDIDPDRIISGSSISSISQSIGLILSGKTGFSNDETGYILGNDEGVQKFYIGTDSDYFNFDGTNVVISGTLTAGAIDIGSGANSFHVDSSGNTWWGAAAIGDAVAEVLKTGVATFTKISISGGSDVTFISDTLDTSAKKILSDFNFGTANYAGAVKTGTIAWDGDGENVTGSGVAMYRKGIVGANDGTVTFSIDATDGSATFAGTITGSTITGGTIQTSDSGTRIVITGDELTLYDSSGYKAMDLTSGDYGINLYQGDAGNTLGGAITGTQLLGNAYGLSFITRTAGGSEEAFAIGDVYNYTYKDILPSSDGGVDLGNNSIPLQFFNIFYKGTIAGDTVGISSLISLSRASTAETTGILAVLSDTGTTSNTAHCLSITSASTGVGLYLNKTGNGAHIRFLGDPTPTPIDGDFWFDGSDLKIRVGESTKTLLTTALWEVDGAEHQLVTADAIDMQSNKIINVTDPTANQDAATKKYHDDNSMKVARGYGTIINNDDIEINTGFTPKLIKISAGGDSNAKLSWSSGSGTGTSAQSCVWFDTRLDTVHIQEDHILMVRADADDITLVHIKTIGATSFTLQVTNRVDGVGAYNLRFVWEAFG